MEVNDELLIKFLLKETSEDENTIVNDWLLENPENVAQFAQLEKIWNASKQLAAKSEVNEEQAWLKFKAKADALPAAQTIVKPLKRNNLWLRIAAVLVVAIASWSLYTVLMPAKYIEVVSTNEVLNKTLPDGSALTINKNTQISYAKNFKTNRNIRLKEGDVFFDVAHDKQHPFVIDVDNVDVEVVGTSFNIKHRKENTEIVVETGIVKVKLGDQEIRLIKGEKLLISPATKQLIKEQNTDQLYNYYRTKLFIANNTPLQKLVATLNEAYGSHIVVDDKVKETFTGPLELGNLDQNLSIICQVLELKLTRNQKEILLSYP
ncbi:FecR family protein [Pedobacter sp. Hv1]|uniref:FecR family protein n=1 Tax=Pedobacter sp. Hv1 TaxID=1740090 RepID=UPI0006D88C42|nr:FecR domain-containing protein [Pedobacter sp. Hv1]KQB99791.1 hypothetical protein AQF98_14830 [Pedobacter sp. Hv1]